jgi:hypothetical protein
LQRLRGRISNSTQYIGHDSLFDDQIESLHKWLIDQSAKLKNMDVTVVQCRSAPNKMDMLPVADRNRRASDDPEPMKMPEEVRSRCDDVYMTVASADGLAGHSCETVIIAINKKTC